jgi:hypothetical protein
MTFDKMGFETMYEFQLDWPEGVEEMSVWAEGLNGDEVVGTTSRVMVTKNGQGGGVSDQSGVGSGSGTNSTANGNGSSGNTTSGGNQENGAGVVRTVSTLLLVVAGFIALVV